MQLRPELLPPPLNASQVARLAKLADRLDGAAPGECDGELAEFNQLAGSDMPLAEFQGINSGENPEDFVRRVLFQRVLAPVKSMTLAEMTEIVSRVIACGDDHDFYLQLFMVNCKHPSGSGLIFWPNLVPEFSQDREPTAEEIAALALRGRDEQTAGTAR